MTMISNLTAHLLSHLGRVGFASFAFLLLSSAAAAHPHMWIDLKSRIILQDDGQVSGIYQEWLFDDFFSTALLEEAARHPQGVAKGVRQHVATIMDNLEPYEYFTLIEMDGTPVPLYLDGDFTAEIRENRVWVNFTVSLKRSVDLTSNKFTYAVFDPTYYIEMFHAENETFSFEGDAPDGCSPKIIEPNPSANAISLSQSAGLDAIPDDTIGRLFAETVAVTCR